MAANRDSITPVELHLCVRIDAEMLDDQSGNDFYRATVGINPNRFALELANGFELGPGNERNRGARNEAGKSFDRQSPNRCRHTGADRSVIINFSADYRSYRDGWHYPDELAPKSFLPEEAALFSQ